MRRSGALVGGLLVGWLMSGCGAEPTQQEMATQEQLQTEEPTGPRAPVLENLEFVPSAVPSAATPGLLRARLAEGEKATQVLLTGDDGRELALRDDGFEGDEKAGDGVFSGFGVADLDEHRKTQERIVSFQKQSTAPLTFATFNDRVLVKETPLTPLPADIFAVGRPIPLPPSGIAQAVVPNKSLIITHPSVVGDTTRTWNPCTGTGNPNGVWTFKHLMTEMANAPATAIQPPALTERWLKQWLVSQTVNGRSVTARSNMATQILNQWPRLTTGELDLNRSPFKLVAIVNRLDLGRGRSGGAYGTSGAGELRFVFAVMNQTTCQRPDYASFLVIFEYGVPRTRCLDVKGWARAWLNLSDPLMSLGSPAYNLQLQNLTQQVVVRNAAPGKPNGSAINQVRTNENLLTNPWEMREFRLFSTAAVPRKFTTTAVPGYLSEHVTVLTPFDLFNNTPILTNFLLNQNGPILAGVHDVPLDFGAATHFLGAFPQMPTAGFFWDAPNLNTVPNGFNARHKFSLKTCTGCHAGETTTPFVHVSATGVLSPFLATGMTNVLTPYNVADPVSGQVRSFYEIRDRAQHLDSAANQSCLVRGFDLPFLSSH